MKLLKGKSKLFFSGSLATLLVIAITVSLIKCNSGVTIKNYNPKRDYQGITNNLKADEYWLFEEGLKFDVDHMLKTKSPDKNPQYYGKLAIKVLLEKEKFAGFITYHKTGYHRGRIQFLSVSKDFRGKSYGKKLVNYALKDLFNQGCTEVSLVTRTDNIPAQKIYNDLGFKEISRDKKFVYFSIKNNN